MRHFLLFFITTFLYCFSAKASHIRGGNITYECSGGNYVFQLVVYRDCNGAELSNISQDLKVWNHPILSSVSLSFVSRTDVSPFGNQVAGGPSCFQCGVGANGGNGLGAIEKVIYRSAPINISGVPPANGWIFTYDSFARSPSITNLQNPDTYGITLVAKIFNVGSSSNLCTDNSPQFLQEPHLVACVGRPFTMNLNAVDPDLDSIVIAFSHPLNYLANASYDPPNAPGNIPFQTGFSVNSPTPNTTSNPGNIPAFVDPSSGEITFTSFISGSFVIKLGVQSYRHGVLISEVENEIQVEITACNPANNPPIITPPFAGLFETTVNAGDLVNFNFTSTDVELLQDGTPQRNYINPTGLLFGSNSTSTTGCIITPCATVSSAPMISGYQGATVNFNWQTDCDHVVNSVGSGLDVVPYHFVFRVQDDYCPVPQVVYATVTINVVNPNVIQAPKIDCIQGSGTGTFTLNWQPVTNLGGSFVEYQVSSVQGGIIANIPAIGTNSFVINGVTQANDYYLAVVSGCNGNAIRYSDTIKNIFLDVSNANPGVADLNWNNPTLTPLPTTTANYYYILREYPAGVWNLHDSVPYGVTNYTEEIDICNINLNYQIQLKNTPCNFMSQIDGGLFDDQTPPTIPVLSSVSIDTITSQTIVSWNQNDRPDTKGYLIYIVDPVSGLLVELDTVYGIATTSYSYSEAYDLGSLTYTVAAFDSCPSLTGAPFNLSARDPNFHTSIFLTSSLTECNSSAILTWGDYAGWVNGTDEYDIFVQNNSGVWSLEGSTTANTYEYIGTPNETYCFAVKAKNTDGRYSFSNQNCATIKAAPTPSYTYIKTATVKENKYIEIDYAYTPGAKVSQIELQRKKRNGVFEMLETIENPLPDHVFIDEEVDVMNRSYTYQVIFLDSCGHVGQPSNIGKTILLNVTSDDEKQINYLEWTPYEEFNGGVVSYDLFRGVDDVFDSYPFVQLSKDVLTYEDPLGTLDFTGEVCYYVRASEGSNIFNSKQYSLSNTACGVVAPLIYIPNAFRPDGGVNPVFKPVITNFDATDYRLTIFDRWGQVVFMTTDYNVGWNGQFDNSKAEAEFGTYVYMVDIRDGGGTEIVKRGFVSLLR